MEFLDKGSKQRKRRRWNSSINVQTLIVFTIEVELFNTNLCSWWAKHPLNWYIYTHALQSRPPLLVILHTTHNHTKSHFYFLRGLEPRALESIFKQSMPLPRRRYMKEEMMHSTYNKPPWISLFWGLLTHMHANRQNPPFLHT